MEMRRKPLTEAERAEEIARAQVLMDWRRADLREAEGAMADAVRSAKALVPDVWKGFNVDKKRSDSQILDLWDKIVPQPAAAHCKPAGIAKGTLFVNVDSSAWLSEIVRYHREEILERVRHAVGKTVVKKISFRVG
jgi:predicted nucleic acid-binding Zn ribbon protein